MFIACELAALILCLSVFFWSKHVDNVRTKKQLNDTLSDVNTKYIYKHKRLQAILDRFE